MDRTFDLCVKILLWLADASGMTYKAVNVWIFVILWPAFTLLLLFTVLLQHRKISRLAEQLNSREPTHGQGT
jgi:hypothetical protein